MGRIAVFTAALFLSLAAAAPGASGEDKSAVILLYHRFGEDGLPSTNIRLEQFEAHIEELVTGGYSALPLSTVVNRLKNKEMLPEKTVVITVDDAYKSVFTEGWPRLKAAGLPMTLFVSTDPVDDEHPNYMSWENIQQLQREGVEIGHHTASHLHMVYEGQRTSVADIEKASQRFTDELGAVPALFAYPYGEFDPALQEAVQELGFDAAFAQYSGPAAHWSDTFALPRFPVNERFGDMNRFRLIAGTRALPVDDLTPQNPVLNDASNPPVFGFTVDSTVSGLGAMACYPSHLGRAADLIRLNGRRIEVRFDQPFPAGRNRINCTMPAGDGRWYWLGSFFYVPGGRLD